ncbi:hypothetical protein L1049_003524 [Liquidambar formosana]|uniref:TF-B3 domain-containing protein n=1 Tax=Liquidambar formosana TaxID=63359 RepID=A0AAP0N603_LIQFO
METQPPFKPHGFLSHSKPPGKEKSTETANKNANIEEDDEESSILTNLTPRFKISTTKKRTIDETNSCTSNHHPQVSRRRKNHDPREEVSTQLTLHNGSFSSNIKQKSKLFVSFDNFGDFLVSLRIGQMKHYSREDEEEEKLLGVSTKLKLYEDPWKIKKRLKESDIGNLSRLLLATESVQAHVIPMLGPDRAKDVETDAGLRVTIWDLDTDTEHGLTFKRWLATGSYVFIKNWRQEFVKRRSLREGDEIGLFWDRFSSRFYFRVLHCTPANRLG